MISIANEGHCSRKSGISVQLTPMNHVWWQLIIRLLPKSIQAEEWRYNRGQKFCLLESSTLKDGNGTNWKYFFYSHSDALKNVGQESGAITDRIEIYNEMGKKKWWKYLKFDTFFAFF